VYKSQTQVCLIRWLVPEVSDGSHHCQFHFYWHPGR